MKKDQEGQHCAKIFCTFTSIAPFTWSVWFCQEAQAPVGKRSFQIPFLFNCHSFFPESNWIQYCQYYTAIWGVSPNLFIFNPFKRLHLCFSVDITLALAGWSVQVHYSGGFLKSSPFTWKLLSATNSMPDLYHKALKCLSMVSNHDLQGDLKASLAGGVCKNNNVFCLSTLLYSPMSL